MAAISKQELQGSGNWLTWVITEGFNTMIVETSYQLTENEALSIQTKYLDDHLYDGVWKEEISIYENRQLIENTVLYIRRENPTLNQWNAYLASLAWNDALLIRFFLAVLARKLADRTEVSLSEYTETEVLSKLKTFFINQPIRRLKKIIFGDAI